MSSQEVQNLFNEAVVYLLGEQKSPQVAMRRVEAALQQDQFQCDLWRATLYMEPTGPQAPKILRAMYRSLSSFGELTMRSSDHFQQARTPGNPNPVSTMLGVAWQLPLDVIIDLVSPTRISAVWALYLGVQEGKFDEAKEVLESVAVPNSPSVHVAWALLYWKSQRWADALYWAEQLFKAPVMHSDDQTIATRIVNGEEVELVDYRLAAAGYLLAGMAHAHLGEESHANRWLDVVTKNDALPSYPVMRRAAWQTRALMQRALGAFEDAQASFASAKSYGTTDELDSLSADDSQRLVFTSAETINQRTSYWDVSTEPSLDKINERRRAEEGSEILARALARMDKQIALWDVKAKVHEFAANEQMNSFLRQQGIEPDEESRYNFVFQGPPGTGKTVTARSIKDMLYGYGIIREDKLIEVSAADLVGSAVGQAEQLTMAKLKEADGGVIFIDEIYQLTQAGDDKHGSNANVFGKKAAETVLKYMEDNPKDCHVIIAGYKYQTDQFIASNPGFKSRFTDYIDFVSYTPNELGEIATLMASERKPPLSFTPEAHAHFVQKCQILEHDAPNGSGKLGDIAGNGRMVRNFIDKARKTINVRMAPVIREGTQVTMDDVTTITVADVDSALDPILTQLY
ncbi:AAA family ATPase [Gordonia sihwensis]|uniref:AAA family ATPase n=1 Tax=Gordonia sihwensis TaxID=173559 RepID=UPI003D995707